MKRPLWQQTDTEGSLVRDVNEGYSETQHFALGFHDQHETVIMSKSY
jgi:hypothetical protein